MEPDDLLLKIYEGQHGQLAYRRQRENEVFAWSSTILLGFTGAALLFSSEDRVVLLEKWPGAILAAVVMALVTAFSVSWQLKQREYLADTQRVIVDIERSLGIFDQKHFAVPEKWAEWGTKNITFLERVLKPSKIAATVLLGALAVMAALLSAALSPQCGG